MTASTRISHSVDLQLSKKGLYTTHLKMCSLPNKINEVYDSVHKNNVHVLAITTWKIVLLMNRSASVVKLLLERTGTDKVVVLQYIYIYTDTIYYGYRFI